AAALAVVVGLLCATTVVLVRERRLRHRAEAAEQALREEQNQTLAQKDKAERRLEDARTLAQRFITVYERRADVTDRNGVYRQGLEAMERLAEGPEPSRQFVSNLGAGYRVLGGWLVEDQDRQGRLAAYDR